MGGKGVVSIGRKNSHALKSLRDSLSLSLSLYVCVCVVVVVVIVVFGGPILNCVIRHMVSNLDIFS